MLRVKKILCPVDLTEHSVSVASYAVMMAQLTNASILVVTVTPTVSQFVGVEGQPGSAKIFIDELLEGATTTLNLFVENNLKGVDVVSKVLVGYPAEEILSIAAEEDVDFIVMGTQGRKGLGRVVFGSVAEKVVKTFKGSVLTIPLPK